jgi:hypothetical protein
MKTFLVRKEDEEASIAKQQEHLRLFLDECTIRGDPMTLRCSLKMKIIRLRIRIEQLEGKRP